MWKSSLLFLLIGMSMNLFSQEAITYQLPPEPIRSMADAQLPPQVWLNRAGTQMMLMASDRYPTLADMTAPEMKLAGLRINPKTYGPSRNRFRTGLTLQTVSKSDARAVSGLPSAPRLSYITPSPDESHVAFTHTAAEGLQLWVVDMKSGEAEQVADRLNGTMGRPFIWFKDGKQLLIKQLPEDVLPLKDKQTLMPEGPKVSTNDGAKAQNRTYQDLLKDRTDEYNFEQLVRAQLVVVDLDGSQSTWKEADMFRGMSFSPDGTHLLISTIHRPFSYLVPYYRFPYTEAVYDLEGNLIQTIEEVQLFEEHPKGRMSTRMGKSDLVLRKDKPATLVWVEALDGGDPAQEVPFRDEVFTWEAPFTDAPTSILKVVNRFNTIIWGNDQVAMAADIWWNTRNLRIYRFNPSNPSEDPITLVDRNYQNRYTDPGQPVTTRNEFDEEVLAIDDEPIYNIGPGYSPKGIYPFVDKLDLKPNQTTRVWQASDTKAYERVLRPVNLKKGIFLSRIESPTDYPNYYLRNIESDEATAITEFANPYALLDNVKKELITYKREDGLELSAVLYLPADYEEGSGERLPLLMWAYPREYKDKASASQITNSPNEFTSVYYGSPIFWVTKGFAILEDAAFPIVGEGDEEPNDSYVKQLVGNAAAAINALDERGIVDPGRVAVGGHSYGAFMTANLLSHSNLFAAGIARSGAYNRTLTPFGFQSEQRTYWDAPEIYYNMSPFMHADKMKTPLLLTHGMEDNNSGTYPLQSERYFNALKGLGATVRLVMLPKESHGYRSRESVMHVLWEQDRWLDMHVKQKETPHHKTQR